MDENEITKCGDTIIDFLKTVPHKDGVILCALARIFAFKLYDISRLDDDAHAMKGCEIYSKALMQAVKKLRGMEMQ